jgi:hypothetical protein
MSVVNGVQMMTYTVPNASPASSPSGAKPGTAEIEAGRSLQQRRVREKELAAARKLEEIQRVVDAKRKEIADHQSATVSKGRMLHSQLDAERTHLVEKKRLAIDRQLHDRKMFVEQQEHALGEYEGRQKQELKQLERQMDHRVQLLEASQKEEMQRLLKRRPDDGGLVGDQKLARMLATAQTAKEKMKGITQEAIGNGRPERGRRSFALDFSDQRDIRHTKIQERKHRNLQQLRQHLLHRALEHGSLRKIWATFDVDGDGEVGRPLALVAALWRAGMWCVHLSRVACCHVARRLLPTHFDPTPRPAAAVRECPCNNCNTTPPFVAPPSPRRRRVLRVDRSPSASSSGLCTS